MRRGTAAISLLGRERAAYSIREANEVALSQFILVNPEGDGLEDCGARELAEMEREYQKNPPSGVITDAELKEYDREIVIPSPRRR